MKVFQVSEADFWLATDIFTAIADVMDETGLPFDEACDDNLHELSDDEMNRLKFSDEENNATVSFADHLKRELDRDSTTPRLFASSEY